MLLAKRRRKTIEYIKDNVFDTIDIESALKENKRIRKIDLKSFIYIDKLPKIHHRLLNMNRKQAIDPSSASQDESLQLHPKAADLFFVYKNGYREPFDLKYRVIDYIGEGSFGYVLSIIEKESNRKMAVKIIHKAKIADYCPNPKNEAHILNRLNHHRIVKIHEVIDTYDSLFIFMDLIEGCSLKDLMIQRYNNKKDYLFTDTECSIIIKGILEGMEYIHSKNIVHRDLKPENIMFKDSNDLNSLVICDFGISEDITHMTPDQCGTTLYMAPEMLLERRCDQLIDVWATGIILYIIASGGKHPIYKYPMSSKEYINGLLLKSDWIFPEQLPILARNLFMKLCKFEPIYRYTTNKAIKHPWITRSSQSVIPMTIVDTYEQKAKMEQFKTMLTAMVLLKGIKDYDITDSLNALSLSSLSNGVVPVQRHLSHKSATVDLPLSSLASTSSTKTPQGSPFAKKRVTHHNKLQSIMSIPTLKNGFSGNKSNNNNDFDKQSIINLCKSSKANKQKRFLLLANMSNSPNKKDKGCLFPPLFNNNKIIKSLKPMKLTIRKTISSGFILDNNGGLLLKSKSKSITQRSIILKNC